MRTKSTVLVSIALAAIAMQGVFTSCSSDESVNTEKTTGLQTLKVNLSPITRGAVYTDPGTAAENKINRVTIGIFDQTTGNVKTIQDAPNAAAPEIITSQLVAGDHILVAVNAPAGTFNGALTESDFEKKTLGIDDALGGGSSTAPTVATTKLPMFGADVIAGSSTTFTSTVAVSHMVAKVTLQSLNVNFDPNGAYQNATFTPLEVFMYNIPDKLDFDFYPTNTPTSYVYNYLTTNTPSYYNGEAGDASVRDYLGTGTTLDASLSGKTLGPTSNWGTVGTKILFLYTMPNTSAKPTQLVIKGTFRPVGTDVGKATVYYPVNINYKSADGTAAEGTTPKQVYPNKNYVIDVTIKGKGVDNPTKSLDPQTVTAHITVNSFVDATQSNTFN